MICDRGNGVRKLLVLITVATLLPLVACFKAGPALLQPTVSISIPNVNLVLSAGQNQVIAAQVYDQSGQGVTWSFSPLNIGALSNPTFDSKTQTASVTYTAPATLTNPANVIVTAASITNPNITSSVTLHITTVSVLVVSSYTLSGVYTPFAAQTVGPAGNLFIIAGVNNDPAFLGVTWSLSPATGAGSLSISPDNSFATYTAPTVSAPITARVTATSVADQAAAATVQITVLPSGGGANVAALNVNGGPVPGQVHPNGAFTSVTICNVGSRNTQTPVCQTVDGVLVDTGSYGLRILQSQIPTLKLSAATDPLGNVLENCASWPDGTVLWGPVETADVYIAGELAGRIDPTTATDTGLPIQVIPSTPSTVPDGCSNTGVSNSNTPQLLGANGILGIGPEPTDCTVSGINYCDGSHQSTPPNLYYACPSKGCATTDSPVVVPALLQVSNPVPYFSSPPVFSPDVNGVIIQLPSVSDAQTSAIGTLTFGIGTQANNSLGSATVLTLDASGNFATMFNGQTLTRSFIDSGASAIFFPDGSLPPNSLPACTTNKEFYCPTSPAMLSATNMGATQGQSTVDFTVEDADSLLFAFPQDAVLGTLAGPKGNHGLCSQGGTACGFDWGLPFFYGRTVYEAIDGQTVSGAPAAPWWAY